MLCMSSALSLPATRNLACCHTKRARSRLVKYLRGARPRANQNSDAPIIIVLSTSKNAAAPGSGGTAAGASTSAAAAEAAPATCARVSSSGRSCGIRAERPRNGRRGTRTSHSRVPGLPGGPVATLTGRCGGGSAGQQMSGLMQTGSLVSISGGLLEPVAPESPAPGSGTGTGTGREGTRSVVGSPGAVGTATDGVPARPVPPLALPAPLPAEPVAPDVGAAPVAWPAPGASGAAEPA